MRISALESDKGYETYAAIRKQGMGVSVTLFGAALSDVQTADVEEGIVVKCLRDPKTRKYVVDPATGMNVLIKLCGPVKITVNR